MKTPEQLGANGAFETKTQEIQETFAGFRKTVALMKEGSALVRALDVLERYDIAAESGLYRGEPMRHLDDDAREKIKTTVEALVPQIDQGDVRGVDRVLSGFEFGRIQSFDDTFEERMKAQAEDTRNRFPDMAPEALEAWVSEGIEYNLARRDDSYRAILRKLFETCLTENGLMYKEIDAIWDTHSKLPDRELGVSLAQYVSGRNYVNVSGYADGVARALEARFRIATARSDSGPSEAPLGQYSVITEPFFKKPQE